MHDAGLCDQVNGTFGPVDASPPPKNMPTVGTMPGATVQQVRRETFLAGEAECGVCGAWVRKPDVEAVLSAQRRFERSVAAMCGVCGTARYFELT